MLNLNVFSLKIANIFVRLIDIGQINDRWKLHSAPFETNLFQREMVGQLYSSDRILQHILLKQLKPTLHHIINKNCYHIHGPIGVKYATQCIREILQTRILRKAREHIW